MYIFLSMSIVTLILIALLLWSNLRSAKRIISDLRAYNSDLYQLCNVQSFALHKSKKKLSEQDSIIKKLISSNSSKVGLC